MINAEYENLNQRLLAAEAKIVALKKIHDCPDGLDPNARMFYYSFQDRIEAKLGEIRGIITNLETKLNKVCENLDDLLTIKGGKQ